VPNALAHAALSLAVLCALGGGSVELFLALTASLAPPLCLALDAALAGDAHPQPPPPPTRRTAAAAGAAASALCVLSERGDTAGAYVAIVCWFLALAAERTWETLLLAPPPPPEGGADSEHGHGGAGGRSGVAGAVEAATRAAHALSSALSSSLGGSAAAGPAPPPSAFEKALYGSALPLLPLALLAVLRGELGAVGSAELSVPALTTLMLSAAAAAGGTAAALLATDVLDGAALARGTAACNVGTLLISHVVAEAPRPTLLGLLASLVAVAAGATFKLAAH
jgi:hypothetical protein